eukprot:6178377-Pleurochrysis_carterae.AAC.2
MTIDTSRSDSVRHVPTRHVRGSPERRFPARCCWHGQGDGSARDGDERGGACGRALSSDVVDGERCVARASSSVGFASSSVGLAA